MAEYLQRMLDLALRKELQGIHFWATFYVLIVLVGTLWHALRVRAWPHVEGELLRIGVRPLGGPELVASRQDYVPSALYRYNVNGQHYEGREISIWKISASGALKGVAHAVPRQVRTSASSRVKVYYNPSHPRKSLLLRPGLASISFVLACIVLTAGFYIWRW